MSAHPAPLGDVLVQRINQVGQHIIARIVEAYPGEPNAADIARDAIQLFIGGMQEPELILNEQPTAPAGTATDGGE